MVEETRPGGPGWSRSGRRHAGSQEIPVNHAADLAPVIQPNLDTGTRALVVATLAWLDTAAGAST